MKKIVLTHNEFNMMCEGFYSTGFDSCVDGVTPNEIFKILRSASIVPCLESGDISVVLKIDDFVWPRLCNHIQWDWSDFEISTLLSEFKGCAKFAVSLREKFKE